MNGAERITEERHRQVALGWSLGHDVDEHPTGELINAAACYLRASEITERAPLAASTHRAFLERRGYDPETDEDFQQMLADPVGHWFGGEPPSGPMGPAWPWEPDAWKPSTDPVRNLEKAGALIAAEIDRLIAVGVDAAGTGEASGKSPDPAPAAPTETAS